MSPPGKVIYVGSIPYDQTEEQVLDIFRSVGPVANFRLVFDKETGRSKGFGFVEYHDAETASSAVRNLNNYQIGNRSIRVDFTHEGLPLSNTAPNSTSGSGSAVQSVTSPIQSLNLPPGKRLPKGSSAAEFISKQVNTYSKPHLAQLLADLKHLANQDPELLHQILDVNPQVSYAIGQCLLALGLVDAEGILGLVEGAPTSAPAAKEETPAPEEPIASESQASQPLSVDPEQAAVIKQVLLLSEEQLAALPPDQQEALKTLKERVQRGEIKL